MLVNMKYMKAIFDKQKSGQFTPDKNKIAKKSLAAVTFSAKKKPPEKMTFLIAFPHILFHCVSAVHVHILIH